MPFAPAVQYLGVGKETTPGTAVAPSLWVPFTNPAPKDDITQLDGKGLRGSMVEIYEIVPGVKSSAFDFDSDFYPDSAPLLWQTILGSTDGILTTAVAAGSNSVNTNTFTGSGVLNVTASGTTGFPTAGTLQVATAGTLATITYTGTTSSTFTGCTTVAGGGVMSTSGVVNSPHQWSLLNNGGSGHNQPPALTLSHWDGLPGANWRQYPGSQVMSIDLTINVDALISQKIKALGFPSALGTKGSNTLTSVLPDAAWQTTTSVGGSASLHMQEAALTFTRKGAVIHNLAGSQTPYSVFVSTLDVGGKITWIADDETELLYYLNNTEQATTLNVLQPGTGYGLQLQATKTHYKMGQRTYGKDWITVETDVVFIPNATDATAGGVSPCQFRILNGSTAAY